MCPSFQEQFGQPGPEAQTAESHAASAELCSGMPPEQWLSQQV